jgi:hypothetical protein
MVTISDAMPIRILIYGDATVSLMSQRVFLTLQIPFSSLTPASPIRGPGDDIVETHDNIMLLVTFRVTRGFQTILVNFFIVGFMLPYEAIITSVAYQATQVSAPPSKSPAPVLKTGTW